MALASEQKVKSPLISGSPVALFWRDFQQTVAESEQAERAVPIALGLIRGDGEVATIRTRIIDPEKASAHEEEANRQALESLARGLLCVAGGYELLVGGPSWAVGFLEDLFPAKSDAAFGRRFVRRMYGRPLSIKNCPYDEVPDSAGPSVSIAAADLSLGNYVGADAGGSNFRVRCYDHGKLVYQRDLPWGVKPSDDIGHHLAGMMFLLYEARAKLGNQWPDAIGWSAPGVFINGEPKAASWLETALKANRRRTQSLFRRISANTGRIVVGANDGSMGAIYAATVLNVRRNILFIAGGTDVAFGFLDDEGGFDSRLHECAFAPFMIGDDEALYDWAGTTGNPGDYIARRGLVRLGHKAGLEIPEGSLDERRIFVQDSLGGPDRHKAEMVMQAAGIALGYDLMWLDFLYGSKIEHVMLAGVMMERGCGPLIKVAAENVLRIEDPAMAERIKIHEPPSDEEAVMGQATAAALYAAAAHQEAMNHPCIHRR